MLEKPCGDEEIRTPDILLAKQALYQLSYVPRRSSGFAIVKRDTSRLRFIDGREKPTVSPAAGAAGEIARQRGAWVRRRSLVADRTFRPRP